MIDDKIRAVVSKRLAFGGARPTPIPEASASPGAGVPTLKPGIHREFSPMLRSRFEEYGRWERATHKDWGFLDMWGNHPGVVEAVRDQIATLRARIAELA